MSLRHHDLSAQLDAAPRQLPALERIVAALDTWQHWANGDAVNTDQIVDAVHVLTAGRRKDRRGQYEALGHTLRDWAHAAGPPPQPARRSTVVSRRVLPPDRGLGVEL